MILSGLFQLSKKGITLFTGIPRWFAPSSVAHTCISMNSCTGELLKTLLPCPDASTFFFLPISRNSLCEPTGSSNVEVCSFLFISSSSLEDFTVIDCTLCTFNLPKLAVDLLTRAVGELSSAITNIQPCEVRSTMYLSLPLCKHDGQHLRRYGEEVGEGGGQ